MGVWIQYVWEQKRNPGEKIDEVAMFWDIPKILINSVLAPVLSSPPNVIKIRQAVSQASCYRTER